MRADACVACRRAPTGIGLGRGVGGASPGLVARRTGWRVGGSEGWGRRRGERQTIASLGHEVDALLGGDVLHDDAQRRHHVDDLGQHLGHPLGLRARQAHGPGLSCRNPRPPHRTPHTAPLLGGLHSGCMRLGHKKQADAALRPRAHAPRARVVCISSRRRSKQQAGAALLSRALLHTSRSKTSEVWSVLSPWQSRGMPTCSPRACVSTRSNTSSQPQTGS